MVMGADGLYFDEIGQLKGIEHWKNIIKAQDEWGIKIRGKTFRQVETWAVDVGPEGSTVIFVKLSENKRCNKVFGKRSK